MGRIVGGIGSSHSPTMGHAFDHKLTAEPMWAPVFKGYGPAKQWLAEQRPDLMIVIYNDHVNRFFFDAYPTFALGVGATHELADEGWGKRPFPPLPGDSAFAWHLAESLVADEFDPTVCQEMTIDHGVLAPLPMLWDPPWPAPIVPLAVNVIQHPLPSARRLYKLGQALRRAVESYPEDLRVVVMGTGGLSHQLTGAQFGHVNHAWDHEFLDLVERDPESLTRLSHADFMARGGAEGVEVIMWLAMRGALGDTARRIHRNYYAPMTAGLGLLVLEGA